MASTEQNGAFGFSDEELLRYSRHLVLPEVGMEGQKKLKTAKVLIVGAGGLGSPLALYLAAAGVGTIGILDFDAVELSNLQRQILHTVHDVGRPKVASAKEHVAALNPHIDINTYETPLTSENAFDIIRPYDIVVDGTDNFPTRYLVNDACVLLKKKNVYGSIFRFDGQVSVFDAENGPCYRCLYPVPPPPGLVPSCAEGGVLGVLPGIIGSLQALETIKLIIGTGDTLTGRLILFDTLKFAVRELHLKKNPECPVCGANPTIHSLVDYDEFCGIQKQPGVENSLFEITPEELHARLQKGERPFMLDVREQYEYDIANLKGYLIPLKELPRRVKELDPAKEIIVYCRTGRRSASAVALLREEGFPNVKNLVGGINAWATSIDTSMPKY
jgi:adenylyltransferase/sulfurtransferase